MTVVSNINKFLRLKGVKRLTRLLLYPIMYKRVCEDINILLKNRKKNNIKDIASVLYLRTDLWAASNKASGAVAHTKGVVEAFIGQGVKVSICTMSKFDYIEKKCKYILVPSNDMLLSGISELAEVEYCRKVINDLTPIIAKDKPSFIYQRYGLNNYSGAYLAKKFGLPFVLEYNGSELWMSHNWGKHFHYEAMSEKIETANFEAADLIVGNAESMQNELEQMGVDKNKILIIPNGVDENRINPDIDGFEIRKLFDFADDDIIVTFVGTFGPWHGAEVLAKTINGVCSKNAHIRYMFVGNGARFEQVKQIVENSGFTDRVVFTGIIPQLVTPKYLAASDILVSPQVPNSDGTPFFGSPTKLFEYMAMGKAIVASGLGQMKDILKDRETALVVTPCDCKELSESIIELSNNKSLRNYIGTNARIDVVNKYTWTKHVDRIISAISSKIN